MGVKMTHLFMFKLGICIRCDKNLIKGNRFSIKTNENGRKR